MKQVHIISITSEHLSETLTKIRSGHVQSTLGSL